MECKGIIEEMINDTTGYILGDNNREYLFNCMDILKEQIPTIGKRVRFKENYIPNPKMNIYYATLITIED